MQSLRSDFAEEVETSPVRVTLNEASYSEGVQDFEHRGYDNQMKGREMVFWDYLNKKVAERCVGELPLQVARGEWRSSLVKPLKPHFDFH